MMYLMYYERNVSKQTVKMFERVTIVMFQQFWSHFKGEITKKGVGVIWVKPRLSR